MLWLCQHLLGKPSPELESICVSALEVFAAHGPGRSTNDVLRAATEALKPLVPKGGQSILPEVSAEKRAAIVAELDRFAALGAAALQKALAVMPQLRDRLTALCTGIPLAGIQQRLDMVAAIAREGSRPVEERQRAAAAILYVDELHDVIPDTLGLIGLLDDDYALRVVLEDLGVDASATLHWSERISSLWDDLPFLQGVDLQRADGSIATTWLDRLNSYVSYTHVLEREKLLLLLLQPSVACSPLHPIVSLLGLLVLDALTSSQSKAQSLRVGQVYEIDGMWYARHEGPSGPPVPGWLRLQFRDAVISRPPTLADRMVPVEARRLSSAREFVKHKGSTGTDPIQRFFDWDQAIRATSISSRLVLVTSRQRALELLEGVQSNGVRLLDHGLVRFVSERADRVETYGSLVLVVPNLAAARALLQQGVRVRAILIDGYERLHRGRYDLPFLLTRPDAPPVITWSATGYYPVSPPSWLPEHRRLEVFPDDLALILELDGDLDERLAPARASLWEAATGPGVRARLVARPPEELRVLEALDSYLEGVRASSGLPEHWEYHLSDLGRTLRLLVAATPAEWIEVRRIADSWSATIDELWSALRTHAASELAYLRERECEVIDALGAVRSDLNAKGEALRAFLVELGESERWRLVCEHPEQVKIVGKLLRGLGPTAVEPVLLRDLAVCCACIVGGWSSSSFARRLRAHTPRVLLALVDDTERSRWQKAISREEPRESESLLTAVDHRAVRTERRPAHEPAASEEAPAESDRSADGGTHRVPCVFVWLAGEATAKVLSHGSRVVVEEGDVARERAAASLRPDDRVILGPGASCWSPAEEFTEAVAEAVEASRPELVRAAREWRRALERYQKHHSLLLDDLRRRLADVGVPRELQTVEGWLRLDRASPIAPRSLQRELKALWRLVGSHAQLRLEEVSAACGRLRALRSAVGRALLKRWKGETVDLGVDEAWLDELADRIRKDVHVYEVESVTFGRVPAAMLGWGISSDLATRFEADDHDEAPLADADGEDEGT